MSMVDLVGWVSVRQHLVTHVANMQLTSTSVGLLLRHAVSGLRVSSFAVGA
jgi:hypothetical protein